MENLKTKMKIHYDENTIPLNRMRDNIREGYCQCCSLPFNEESAYILGNCCQIIICEDCITVKSSHNKTLIRKCPNCAVELSYTKDKVNGLIKVGNNINLEDALSDNIILQIEETEQLPTNHEDKTLNMKVKALIKLLETTDKITDSYCLSDNIVPPYISGLLIGRKNIPHTGKNKYLIFALLTESTHFLHNELSKRGIYHEILQGTRVQKNNIITKFENECDILLITATNDCAGLHLPFVSHIIFYHKIIDHNIESQIAARGQRLGRTANLEIISLLYQYE